MLAVVRVEQPHPPLVPCGERGGVPPCGSEARRAAQMVSVYSYSINIFGLSTSCPLPPRYAQGYAVGRHYHAVLRGRIVAEDDGTEGLVHSSTITNLWLLLIDVLHRLAPNTPTWWLPKWVSIHSP